MILIKSICKSNKSCTGNLQTSIQQKLFYMMGLCMHAFIQNIHKADGCQAASIWYNRFNCDQNAYYIYTLLYWLCYVHIIGLMKQWGIDEATSLEQGCLHFRREECNSLQEGQIFKYTLLKTKSKHMAYYDLEKNWTHYWK